MANQITDARRSLIRAKEAAMKRLDDLERERREVKASVRSLDAALKALEKPARKKAFRDAAGGASQGDASFEGID